MPCGGETWIAGSPASSLARTAAPAPRRAAPAGRSRNRRPRSRCSCATARSIKERRRGRKPGAPTERAGMETASRRARRRERWLQRAERVSDAFGLVLILVLITYVLASLLDNRGWTSVLLTRGDERDLGGGADQLARAARSCGGALALSALTVALAAVGAASGDHDWLNLATLIQVSLLSAGDGRGAAPRRHGPRSRLAHDPRRAQRLRRARHPLHLPLRGDRPRPGRALLRRPSPTPRAPTSSSSATRR